MRNDIKDIKLEIFTAQQDIINLQSEAIDELLKLIVMHDDVSTADFASASEKIDKAEAIRSTLKV